MDHLMLLAPMLRIKLAHSQKGFDIDQMQLLLMPGHLAGT